MNDTSKISICCITYNHEEYIKEAIESIWNQDYGNMEIIVVDDGSTDSSFEILRNLQKVSPVPMLIFTQKNTYNIGLNLNRVIAKASGDFVMFLSLDDYLLDSAIQTLVAEIEKDDALQFVFAAPKPNTACFDVAKVNYESITVDELLDLEKMGGSFWLSSAIYKKSIVDSVHGFDEDMTGDDIVLRVKLLKFLTRNPQYLFRSINGDIFHHRLHATNLGSNSRRQCKTMSEVMQRYFNGEQNPMLEAWIEHAIRECIVKGEFIEAIRFILGQRILKYSKRHYLFKTLDEIEKKYAMQNKTMAELERSVVSRDSQIVDRDSQIVDRDNLITDMNRNICNLDQKIESLDAIVESAKRWQRRSWFKRAFHKWRPK